MKYIRLGIVIVFAAAAMLWLTVRILVVGDKDTVSPVITSTEEEIEVSVHASAKEMLTGLTAVDDVDGDISNKIRVGEHSKFITDGTCKVSYLVFDSSFNVGQYSRKVTYTDYESPKFTLNAPLIYEEGLGYTPSVLNRVGAEDMLDGDISGKIKIISNDIDSTEANNYVLTLEVANEYADISQITLPVHVVDDDSISEEAPQIRLAQYLVYKKKGEQLDPKEYVEEVLDAEENSIDTDFIKIENKADTSREGVYEIKYSYKGSNGITGITYLVVVVTE